MNAGVMPFLPYKYRCLGPFACVWLMNLKNDGSTKYNVVLRLEAGHSNRNESASSDKVLKFMKNIDLRTKIGRGAASICNDLEVKIIGGRILRFV